MDKGIRICKVCGKEYPYCKNWNSADTFRWQDVACCEEHGKEYFAAVMRARGGHKEAPKAIAVESKPVVEKNDTGIENAAKDLKKNK